MEDIDQLIQQIQADMNSFADFANEQGHFEWRTIGASGPEGHKHGGTHVQINTDTGAIAKGPSKFVGKTVDQVKKENKAAEPWSLTQQSAAPTSLWGEWGKPQNAGAASKEASGPSSDVPPAPAEKTNEPPAQSSAPQPEPEPVRSEQAGPVARRPSDDDGGNRQSDGGALGQPAAGEGDAGKPKPLATFTNKDGNVEVQVHKGPSGYGVSLKDLDSGEFVPSVTFYPDEKTAIEKAKKAAGVKGPSPIDAALDQAKENAKAAGVEVPSEQKAEPKKEKPAKASKTPTVDKHFKFMDRVQAGEVSPDELKENYQSLRTNAEAVKKELGTMNKAELDRMSGGFNRDMTKDRLIDSAYHAMLRHHGVGRTFQYSPFAGKDAYEKAMDAHVAETNPEHIADYAKSVAASRKEMADKIADHERGVANPQSLLDFHRIIRAKGKAKAVDALDDAQLAKYDDLQAQHNRENRAKEGPSTTVSQVTGTPEGLSVELKETKHTKTGEPLHVAVINQRVERDKYDELNRKAKMLGGWYSSFRGGGAIPGFQFKSKESAEKFKSLLSGDVDRSDDLAKREEEKKAEVSSRLADTADSIRSRAEEQLNADRKTNTHRRAEMAAGMEARARGDIAKANTLTNIADKIKEGSLKHLNGVKAGTHVDQMDRILRAAKWNKIKSTMNDQPWDIKENESHAPPSPEDIRHVEYPHPKLWQSELRRFSKDLADTPGVMRIAQKLGTKAEKGDVKFKTSVGRMKASGGQIIDPKSLAQKGIHIHGADGKHIRVHQSHDWRLAKEVTDRGGSHRGPFYTADAGKSFATTPENAIAATLHKGHALDLVDVPEDKMIALDSTRELEDASKAAYRLRRHPDRNLRSIGERLHDQVEQAQRLRAMDIHTTAELRAALREYLPIRAQKENEDPVKKMERGLIGRKIPGFFPTPKPLIHRMVDAADIQPGMSVLEPSAGRGDILDVVKERHSDADTEGVEPNSSLRELISAKGHKLAGEDFLQHPSEKKYDRIIMNPPWGSEFGQIHEADHVKKAFEHLKPNGRMVAVVSASPFHNQSKKAQEFRDWLDSVGGVVEDLPEGSFSGDDAFRQTGVNTKMITIDKGEGETPKPDQTFSDIAIHSSSLVRDILNVCKSIASDFAAAVGYPKPKSTKFAGLNIAIENPRCSTRSGVNKAGKRWSTKMKHDYGFIRRATGADGEGLDCFIGPDAKAKDAYIIHQNDPETGMYDEDKTMLGFATPSAAKAAYLANYDTPKFFRSMTIMPMKAFREMLTSAKPGGAHWKRKNKRPRSVDAIFASEDGDDFHSQMGFEWKTIGAVDHHGGVHVQIKSDTGEIVKGPSGMRGQNVDELKPAKKEEPKPAASIPTSLWGEWEQPKKAKSDEPEAKGPTEDDQAEQLPAAGPSISGPGAGHPGDRGVGSDAAGSAGGSVDRRDEPKIKPPEERIVTARPHLTKAADPSFISESLQQHLAPHQLHAAALAVESMTKHGGFLNASGTGAGKTRAILAVAKTFADQGFKVLITAPKQVHKANWDKGTFSGSFRHDSNAMGIAVKLNDGTKTIAPGEVHLSTYEKMKDLAAQVDDNTILLFDESHYLKNSGTKKPGKNPDGTPKLARGDQGVEMAKKARAVMYATATPADKPEHVAHLARARVFGNRPRAATWFELGMEKAKRGGGWKHRKGMRVVEKHRRLSGLFDKMTEEGLMIKQELDFTGVPIDVDRMKFPAECHEAMDKIEEHIAGGDESVNGLKKALVLMHQRRQQEPYKIPAVVNRVKKELAEGRSVIVFASRVNKSDVGGEKTKDKGLKALLDMMEDPVVSSEGTLKTLKQQLHVAGIGEVLELHGGVSEGKRLDAMNRFQASKKPAVVIATIESGGTGINLDDVVGNLPRSMLIMTAPFSAVENMQSLGRTYRLKTASMPRYFYMFGDTDVDAWNEGLIRKKMGILGAAVAGESAKMDIPAPEWMAEQNQVESFEHNPYKWHTLLGPATSVVSEPEKLGGIKVKMIVGRKTGKKYYLHEMGKPTPEIQALANSPHKPGFLSVRPHFQTGQPNVTVFGDNEQHVRDNVEELKRLLANPPKADAPSPHQHEKPPEVIDKPLEEKPATGMQLPPEQIQHVIDAAAMLAGACDGAQKRDDAGFSGQDVRMGHWLATGPSLTTDQAIAAAHRLRKYARQLGSDQTAKLDAIIAAEKAHNAKQSEKDSADPHRVVALTGNTYKNKDALRRAGFRWHPGRGVWYGKRSLIGDLPQGVRAEDFSDSFSADFSAMEESIDRVIHASLELMQ